MLSFWEKEAMLKYDVAIIGGGIVGLSTAISIKQLNANAEVAIFDAGVLPTGASTKNAGFACFGSVTELLDDLSKMTESQVLELVEMRWNGLQILKNRLGASKIDLKQHGGYELITHKEEYAIDKIEYINKLLQPLFLKKVFGIDDSKIETFGFNPKKVKHLIFNQFEAQIQPALMMKNLIKLAGSLGVKIYNHTKVKSFSDTKSIVEIKTENGLNFYAPKMAICTNAFTQQLFPEIELEPGRGQVIVTSPIHNLPFKGIFHYDEGYYYFRNFGKRVVFGGGRNLAFEHEKTTVFENTDLITNNLEKLLREVILPNHNFTIEHKWAGIMAFGKNKKPICQKISENVAIGVRLGGMGVAIGSYLGEKLAKILMSG